MHLMAADAYRSASPHRTAWSATERRDAPARRLNVLVASTVALLAAFVGTSGLAALPIHPEFLARLLS